jgi:hypothetical protein
VPLVDDYLEFLAGRCRPNTVLAAAYDLRVFFGVVDKPPDRVRPADVLGFITSQRTGRGRAVRLQTAAAADHDGGVALGLPHQTFRWGARLNLIFQPGNRGSRVVTTKCPCCKGKS